MKHRFVSYYLDSPLQSDRIYDVFMPENMTREMAVFIFHGGGGARGRVPGISTDSWRIEQPRIYCRVDRLPG